MAGSWVIQYIILTIESLVAGGPGFSPLPLLRPLGAGSRRLLHACLLAIHINAPPPAALEISYKTCFQVQILAASVDQIIVQALAKAEDWKHSPIFGNFHNRTQVFSTLSMHIHLPGPNVLEQERKLIQVA